MAYEGNNFWNRADPSGLGNLFEFDFKLADIARMISAIFDYGWYLPPGESGPAAYTKKQHIDIGLSGLQACGRADVRAGFYRSACGRTEGKYATVDGSVTVKIGTYAGATARREDRPYGTGRFGESACGSGDYRRRKKVLSSAGRERGRGCFGCGLLSMRGQAEIGAKAECRATLEPCPLRRKAEASPKLLPGRGRGQKSVWG